MITMDSDQLIIEYPHMFALMHDLEVRLSLTFYKAKNLFCRVWQSKRALTNAQKLYAERHLLQQMLFIRCKFAVFFTKKKLLQEMYAGSKSGTIRATFDVLNAIAWKPGPKMPKPAERGSHTVSLADLSSITESGGKVK